MNPGSTTVADAGAGPGKVFLPSLGQIERRLGAEGAGG
jgi:hypothetical protein